jgi:hypothetical protein
MCMKSQNIKLILKFLFLISLFAEVSCTKSLEQTLEEVTATENKVTITAPASATADSTNQGSFQLDGSCKASDSISVTVSTISVSVTCTSSGTWTVSLDLTSLSDGAYNITVTSSADPSKTATVAITKSVSSGGGGASCVGGPTTFTTNMNARYVIGQADFVSNSANRGGTAAADTLNNPIGIAVKNGKLYVADAGNNRVLIFNTLPTANGVSADVVVGQANFTSTGSGTSATSLNGIQGIAVSDTYLAVGEWSNSRVSLWPLSAPSAATVFLGQPNGTTNTVNTGGISDARTGAVTGVAFANNKLFVGDVSNARVLAFDMSTPTTGMNASQVIGQTNFTNNATGSGMTGFGGNYSLSSDGTHLLIMDNNADRVLLYNSMPVGNGGTADVAWGGWGVTNLTLANPVGVFIGDNKMFIADRNSDRVLVFNSIPTSSASTPDAVLGQANFTTGDHNQCNCATAAANTLWGVHHIYWDGCRLYVTDKQNNRVLVY